MLRHENSECIPPSSYRKSVPPNVVSKAGGLLDNIIEHRFAFQILIWNVTFRSFWAHTAPENAVAQFPSKKEADKRTRSKQNAACSNNPPPQAIELINAVDVDAVVSDAARRRNPQI
jgi:hypothetical protein